jgi:hypothetical protein
MKFALFALLFFPYTSGQDNVLTSHFNLIDSKTHAVIGELPDFVNYFTIDATSSRLNIEAVFDPAVTVASVRMTFDDPQENNCRSGAPYQVFSSNGVKIPLTSFDGTVPVGRRKVTATPYSRSRCKGDQGTTIEKAFIVGGCDIFGRIIDVSTDTVVQDNIRTLDLILDSVPCQVNIEAVTTCGFPIKTFNSTLLDRTTGAIIHEQKDHKPGFYLFGKERDDAGSMPAGKYVIKTWVNDIEHYTINVTVSTDNCF